MVKKQKPTTSKNAINMRLIVAVAIIAVVVIAALVLLSMQKPTNTPHTVISAPAQEGLTTYENHGFKFTYPASWKVGEQEDNTQYIVILGSGAGDELLIIGKSKYSLNGTMDDHIAKLPLNQPINQGGSTNIFFNSSKTTFNGNVAYLLTGESHSAGGSSTTKMNSIITIIGGNLYSFAASNFNTVQSVLDSFEIV